MTPPNNNATPNGGPAPVAPRRSISITGQTLRTQAWAAFALSCVIPAMLIGYLTTEYILPRTESRLQVYAAIGFAFLVAVCGSFLMVRIIRQIQRLTQSARSVAVAHTNEPVAPPSNENELFQLGLAITRMGEALRNQVVELQDKADKLAELNQKLQEANLKLGQYNEMKSELVVLATREFRNPIAAIMEAVSLVLHRQLGDLNDRQMRMLSLIHANACKASRLLEELLTIARVRADNKDFNSHEIDLTTTLTNILLRIGEVTERKKLTVSTALPVDHIVTFGYAQETELALECAIANAVELASEKTTLEVAAKYSPPGSIVVIIQVQQLSINAHAFERLANALNAPADAVRDWSGIGSIELPLAKEIVHLLGGQIRVEQTPDHHLVFQVTLPKGLPTAGAGAATPAREVASAAAR
jgi:signal transduction histidine kinase